MVRRFRTTDDGKRRLVRRHRGMDGYCVTWTSHCTGCCELGDYMGLAHQYEYDDKARCYVGAGCHECGYTGKRRETHWVPFDFADGVRLTAEAACLGSMEDSAQ